MMSSLLVSDFFAHLLFLLICFFPLSSHFIMYFEFKLVKLFLFFDACELNLRNVNKQSSSFKTDVFMYMWKKSSSYLLFLQIDEIPFRIFFLFTYTLCSWTVRVRKCEINLTEKQGFNFEKKVQGQSVFFFAQEFILANSSLL